MSVRAPLGGVGPLAPRSHGATYAVFPVCARSLPGMAGPIRDGGPGLLGCSPSMCSPRARDPATRSVLTPGTGGLLPA